MLTVLRRVENESQSGTDGERWFLAKLARIRRCLERCLEQQFDDADTENKQLKWPLSLANAGEGEGWVRWSDRYKM